MATRQEIRDILGKMSFDLPSYDGIEWRLDLQVLILYPLLREKRRREEEKEEKRKEEKKRERDD